MKKNLILLTGIVLLIAVLVAGGCKQAVIPPAAKNPETVIIYLKAVKVNEENHLEMYDSNDPSRKVIDTLHTYVQDTTQVFWTLAENSGIKSIKRIKPKEDGKIITRTIRGAILVPTEVLMYKIPKNQIPNTQQGYRIKVKDTEGNKWEIDPYLRLPNIQ